MSCNCKYSKGVNVSPMHQASPPKESPKVTPKPPLFTTVTPPLATLCVVRLTEGNVTEVGIHVLGYSGKGVDFPPTRDSFTMRGTDGVTTRFDVGDFVIEEFDPMSFSTRFRHATEDEVQIYALRKRRA